MTVDSQTADRRILLVHAHPDDETITSGVTMARYLAEGAKVTLITCTAGEEGEVLIPALEHLSAKHSDTLGKHRVQELAEAMDILGVTDHRFLGGVGTYRDSGMMGEPANEHPQCFWRADLLEAATHLVSVIREVRPTVLITYDEVGQYGHPDHIQAHRVAMYAQVLAATDAFRPDLGPAWNIERIYWPALPKEFVRRGIDAFIAAGGKGFFGLEEGEELPFAIDDELVTTQIDGVEFEPKKIAALRAHATQVEQEGDFFAVSEIIGPEALGFEFFRLAKGEVGPLNDEGREIDLFG